MDCIEFVEQKFNIKLLPIQKEIIKEIENKDNIYVCYPPRMGRKYFLEIIEKVKEIIYGGNDGKTCL